MSFDNANERRKRRDRRHNKADAALPTGSAASARCGVSGAKKKRYGT
ncbi:hypothetical protein [Cryobacterium sp. Hh7]|nr:hypothetical protein [Cryobacterium sp. Hh7]